MYSQSHTGHQPNPNQPVDRPDVLALRQPAQDLATSTLSFLASLREEGVLVPLRLQSQRHLVLHDGGMLDLALDRAWPDGVDPGDSADRQRRRLRLVERQFAEPLVDDEPYEPFDPRVSADRGAEALDALRAAPLDAEQMIDALERHRVLGGDDLGAAA